MKLISNRLLCPEKNKKMNPQIWNWKRNIDRKGTNQHEKKGEKEKYDPFKTNEDQTNLVAAKRRQ